MAGPTDKLLELIDDQPDEQSRKVITDLLSIEGKAKLLDLVLAQRDKGVKPNPADQPAPEGSGVAGMPSPGSSASGVTPPSGNAPEEPAIQKF